MDVLLSHSFDYLSSYDAGKIRKGLRQVEGLLAQICLSKSKTPAERRRSVLGPTNVQSPPKELSSLKDDAAFREFFRLQEGFEWNVAIRLISTLERLLGKSTTGANELLIISTLDLIQGVLLLHPSSRSLFAREVYMNLLLDLLEPSNCPAVQSATLLTLVTALLENPQNTRTFEALDGLLTVTSLFKARGTSREVKLKLVEFLYFYLMPETPAMTMASAAPSVAVGLQRTPSKMQDRRHSTAMGSPRKDVAKTTEEKQEMLGRYLNNVEDLVEDLQDSAPFGGTVVQ
ncbi:MAG: hypothetical protein M1834_002188 [Cirrosporium novae-zelandiae]|nr:MAG: hypothetical protein M1834_002188 [Cirrosporium novae-zelandiae]